MIIESRAFGEKYFERGVRLSVSLYLAATTNNGRFLLSREKQRDYAGQMLGRDNRGRIANKTTRNWRAFFFPFPP